MYIHVLTVLLKLLFSLFFSYRCWSQFSAQQIGCKAPILWTNCFTETILFSFLFLQVLVTILYFAIGSKAPILCTYCMTETFLFFSYRCWSQFSAQLLGVQLPFYVLTVLLKLFFSLFFSFLIGVGQNFLLSYWE